MELKVSKEMTEKKKKRKKKYILLSIIFEVESSRDQL